MLDDSDGQLKLAAHVGLPDHVAAIVAVVPVGKGMAGLAAQRLEPVQTCNLQTDTTGDIRPGAKAVPVQASIAVPMIVDGRLRGVLGFAKARRRILTSEVPNGPVPTISKGTRSLPAW